MKQQIEKCIPTARTNNWEEKIVKKKEYIKAMTDKNFKIGCAVSQILMIGDISARGSRLKQLTLSERVH